MILVTFALAALMHWSWYGAGIGAAVGFYMWGMARALNVLDVIYQKKSRESLFFMMSEGAENGIMIWFVFSWLTYYLARDSAAEAAAEMIRQDKAQGVEGV